MKTAKSIEVARLAGAASGKPGGHHRLDPGGGANISPAHGVTDMLYAVGITPQKLDEVAKLNAVGAEVMVITDDPADGDGHRRASGCRRKALIEIDCGEGRGGLLPDDDRRCWRSAARLGPRLAGVMTHAGHSYAGRSAADMREHRRGTSAAAVVARRGAAARRRPGRADRVDGQFADRAARARTLDGVTEVRAGVYMFGDLFQAEIGTHRLDDIAVTVLASVIGRRPGAASPGAGCRRAGAVEGSQHGGGDQGLRVRPGAGSDGGKRAYGDAASCGAPIRSMAWWSAIPAFRCPICRSAARCGSRRTMSA